MKVKLNEGQKGAVRSLMQFMQSDKQFFTLDGPAGTGKTFCITHYIRTEMALCKFQDRHMPRVYLSAPTHKAVSVIADLLEEDSLQVDCGTIHSLLGLYLTPTGELKQLADGGMTKLGDYAIVIADEGSMIDVYLFEKFQEKLAQVAGKGKKVKVIFLGDNLQLDPVKGSQSPVFSFTGATLTEQMRQLGDNPIGDIIALARNHVEDSKPMPRAKSAVNAEEDGVHIVKQSEFKEMILANFDTEQYQEDSHFCKVLAWRNREVDKWNKIVRDHLLGADADQIVKGEILILQSSVKDLDDRVLMHTEQEVVVNALAVDYLDEEHFDHGHRRFKVWVVSGQTKDGIFGTFEVLHRDSLEDYNKYTQILRNSAGKERRAWATYWEFCDRFVSVRPPFACTIHKSQGSSFDNVFVVMTDVLKNARVLERNRLVYVGLSRAKTNIIMNTGRMS